MTVPGVLFLIGLIIAGGGAVRRILLWRRGRSDGTGGILAALATVPARYFRDVHTVVVRDGRAARMHIFAGGGFVATCVLIFVVHVLGATAPVFVLATLLGAGVMGLGAAMAWRRRRSGRPSRLSGGPYDLLPYALGAFAVFYFAGTVPLLGESDLDWRGPMGLALLPLGVFGTAFLLPGLTIGPMRHAFAGAAHLAFHPRAERFGGERAVTLKPLDLEAEKLGVETPQDFTWRQILSYDACVQCGRCEDACPVYAAGGPLNPKKLIFDLWATSAGDPVAADYAGHPYPGLEDAGAPTAAAGSPVIGRPGGIAEETLWACTTCRACVEECPMMIEHVDAVIDLRRFETLEKGATPDKGAVALETLAQTDTASGRHRDERLDWASDLNLPLARDRRRFDVLLWLGENAFDLRGQKTLRALIGVLRAGGVDFAVLGEEERDVGDIAQRLGDEAGFQRLAEENIATLAKYQFNRIVTNDPHVLQALKHEYPAFGGRYEVAHHTTFVSELIETDALQLSPIDAGAVTYHDPCYLGRYNGEFDAPRALINALGLQRPEMERSGPRSFCCGWGGGAALTDIPSKARVPDLRMAQAKATGAESVAVACPNCAVMLEGVTDAPLAVVDVIELVALAVTVGRAEAAA
ncbi:MAG: (Fe-S)-binding protein [Sphingomonadales bacterium]|nr:(Fe-S)-binding protein [Sphingomonadales bacterium]